MAFKNMYYPKLVYASFTIEGLFLFGILCLFNKIYGLESLYYIGNFQIRHMEEPNKSQWETPLLTSQKSIFERLKEIFTLGEKTVWQDSKNHLYPIYFFFWPKLDREQKTKNSNAN